VSSAFLSLFDAVSREHRRTYFRLFTFVFKYSLRMALVKAHAFYGYVSLETLVCIKKKGHSSFMCIISVREVPDFDFKNCLFSAVVKNFDHSLPCFSVGWDILRLFGKIYVNSFSIKSQLQQILCVLGMYALFDDMMLNMRRRTEQLMNLRFCAQFSTCQSSCCDTGFFVDKHFTLFNLEFQSCHSDSGFTVHEVKI